MTSWLLTRPLHTDSTHYNKATLATWCTNNNATFHHESDAGQTPNGANVNRCLQKVPKHVLQIKIAAKLWRKSQKFAGWRLFVSFFIHHHNDSPLERQPWLDRTLSRSPHFQKSNIESTNLSIDQTWATIHSDGRKVSLRLVVRVSGTSGHHSNSDEIVSETLAAALSGIPFHYFPPSDFISFISVSAANPTRSI